MARTRSLVLVSAVFGIFAIAACATAARSDREDTQSGSTEGALIGGEAGSPYNSGAVLIWAGHSRCTGVMVSPNQILTAAHCVVNELLPDGGLPQALPDGAVQQTTIVSATVKSDYQPNAQITFSNNQVITNSSALFWTKITHTDLAPDFQTACGSNTCGNAFSITPPYPPDLAIITVADTFPQSFGLASTIASAAPLDPVTEVGYGCTQSVNLSNPNPATFKFASSVILNPTGTVPAPFSVTNLTAFAQNYYLTPGVLGGGQASLCPGDSGGPLFKGGLSPYTNVVGINAYYFFPNTTGVSSVNVFARLDSPNVKTFLANTINQYSAPTPAPGLGAAINDRVDPISSLFPVESVSLETPGTPGCTGVILTKNSVLTAAHCQVGPTTIAHFYYSTMLDPADTGLPDDSGVGRHVPGLSINGVSAIVQPGVNCNPMNVATYPLGCFVSTGSTGAYHNADLAILTLASDVPSDFMPAILGARGLSSQDPADSIVWWEVAAGGPTPINDQSSMMWSPVKFASDPSGLRNAQGWFSIASTYGEWNDTGGPIFQAPPFGDDAGPDGGFFMGNATLVGIVSDVGTCPQGVLNCTFTDTAVSVTFPDNYDWLAQQGGSPVPQVASFGAAQ